MFFKRKYSVTILDEKWSQMQDSLKLFVIPRIGEMVYMDTNKKYFKVVNVVHYLNNKHGIFIIVAPFENK
jgi:hypothetical protein